jgi:hypothetical protein
LLEHLEHLHETNSLFGNVAKSQSEGKRMSLSLRVVAEELGRVQVQNDIGLQDEAQRFVEEPDNGGRRVIVLCIRMVSGGDSLG